MPNTNTTTNTTTNTIQQDMQHAFDVALSGIRAQGHQSMDDEMGGVYRDGNGNKCAIGHNIPDASYDKSFDSEWMYGATDVSTMLYKSYDKMNDALKAGGIKDPRAIAPFLAKLQDAHDSLVCHTSFVEAFETSMAELAKQFKLTYNAPV